MAINRAVMSITVFLFLILPSTYAIGLMDVPDYFEVLPNKTYSADFCVIEDQESEGTVSLSNNSGLIADFYVDEFHDYVSDSIFDGVQPIIKCTTMHIKISDYKTSNEELIVEELTVVREVSKNLNLAVAAEITFDASEVSYVNALLKFSWRLVLTILSIFVVLTSLLYMIRKIRKE